MHPEKDDVKELESDSSADAEILDEPKVEPAKAEPEAEAKPSDAADADKSALSIVRDVVGARKDDKSKASSADGEQPGQDPGDPNSKKEPDDENFSDVPFSKHPRFQRLIRQRNEFRHDASQFQRVVNFLRTHGLEGGEASDVLTIAAMAKTDAAKAWKEMQPWLRKVAEAAGEIIPDDLKERVQRGEITPEVAQEISIMRAARNSVEARQVFEEQKRQREAVEQERDVKYNAALAWEEDRRRKDPHFADKYAHIQKEVVWLQTQGDVPKTPEDVKKQLDAVYKAVNEYFRPPVQAVQRLRPPLRPVMSGQTGAPPKPESTIDIIRARRATA